MTHAATQGACLCGAVRYEVDGPFAMTIHCHCSMCRKHHGSAFATFVSAPLMGFRWLSGEHEVRRYRSSAHSERGFCKICGSVTPMPIKSMDVVICPAGNLLGTPQLPAGRHIFVGSKASWYEITDSLPQYEEYPPEFGALGVARTEIEARPGVVAGSCLCGQVAFEITGAALRVRHCHCTRCRRGRSAAHATNVLYKLEDFRFTRGEAQVVDYKVPEAQFFAVAFCDHCGGALPRISRERGFVVTPAGSLDTDPAASAPAAHIFTGSKANWFDITDRLQQFEAMQP
ncbi:MAG TPA: GFA family protein [Steroidobacteraceae bacterium]|jgi:hypothetical protein